MHIFGLFLLLLLIPRPVYGGWEAALGDQPAAPAFFLAIEKRSQTLYTLSHQSPLKIVEKLPCTTGQALGDKEVAGDLRTPEGVYFIQSVRSEGLDFDLYGNRAFTLNFPNAMDRLRGKTGAGIWIHGRGRPIEPRETKGCVAVNDPDLERLAESLLPGTPVVISDTLRFGEDQEAQAATARALIERTTAWATAEAARAPERADFFDLASYRKAGMAQDLLPVGPKGREAAPIRQAVTEIRALPGPDYWVTWFDRYAHGEGGEQAAVTRLYWRMDASGAFRIVAGEEGRAPAGFLAAQRERLAKDALAFVDSWRAVWLKGDLDGYGALYAAEAEQQGRDGRDAILEHKRLIWSQGLPERIDLTGVTIRPGPDGVTVTFAQDYASRDGYADRGEKSLVLLPRGDSFVIVRETWTPTS